MEIYSFQNGLNQLKKGEIPEVEKELRAFLKVNIAQYYKYKNGATIPRADKKEGIEAIFVKHGVKKSKIWGTSEKIPS